MGSRWSVRSKLYPNFIFYRIATEKVNRFSSRNAALLILITERVLLVRLPGLNE